MARLTMRALAVESFVHMLGALTYLFEKAEEAAAAKKRELSALTDASCTFHSSRPAAQPPGSSSSMLRAG